MSFLEAKILAKRFDSTLTDLLQELKADEEAVGLLDECYPELWDDLADNGFTCLDIEQYRPAGAIFQFLVDYLPNDASFQAGLADSRCGLKAYQEAAEAYEQTIRQAPHIPEAYLYLAEIYMMMGHTELALPLLGELQKLLADQPAHPLFRESLTLQGYAEEALQQRLI